MNIQTIQQLREVLKKVTFRKSCVNLKWEWEVETVYNPDGSTKGWFVNTTFERPDTETGEVGRGAGRQEFIKTGTSDSGVVKTCWLLAELIVRHELMEAFQYDGVRIFNPHHTVEELALPQLLKEKRQAPSKEKKPVMLKRFYDSPAELIEALRAAKG